MYLCFVDDSRQDNPTREKLNTLLALGCVLIKHDYVKRMESEIDLSCELVGFPPNEIFKWSPDKTLWMRCGLTGPDRFNFQKDIIVTAANNNCKAIFAAVDAKCNPATTASSPMLDVVNLLFERIEGFLHDENDVGIVIFDRTGSDRKEEQSFLGDCIDSIKNGTDYVKFERLIMSPLCLPNNLSRMLQVADLVVGSMLSYVSGETVFSPPIVKEIMPLLFRCRGCVGGVGVKLHPHKKMQNLYHWLFGDTVYVQGGNVIANLPIPRIAFARNADDYY